MPNLILILGPPAVGKATIGVELSKLLDYRLFHTQLEYDFVLNFFPQNSKEFNILTNKIKLVTLNQLSQSDISGVIFTTSIDFKRGVEILEQVAESFKKRGGMVFIVELYADLKTRMIRNKLPNRSLLKPIKKDKLESENILMRMEESMQLNSDGLDIELYKNNPLIYLNNSTLSLNESVKIIIEKIKNCKNEQYKEKE